MNSRREIGRINGLKTKGNNRMINKTAERRFIVSLETSAVTT
jgi:hypothetical protein